MYRLPDLPAVGGYRAGRYLVGSMNRRRRIQPTGNRITRTELMLGVLFVWLLAAKLILVL